MSVFYPTGVRSSNVEEIAKAMFKAMRKFEPETLRTVRVVVFQRDMVPVFLSTLKDLSQSFLTRVKECISEKYKGTNIQSIMKYKGQNMIRYKCLVLSLIGNDNPLKACVYY
jgi:hypothetical protein